MKRPPTPGPKALLIGAIVLAVACAGVFAWLALRDNGLPEGAALEVNGDAVTVDEMEERMSALHALYGVRVPPSGEERDKFKRDTAKSMAVQILLDEAAAEKEIAVADKVVNDALATLVKQRYPDGGRDAFVQALGQMGASEAQVRDELHQQILVARLFDDVTAGVEVSDDEVRTAFEERRAEISGGERMQLRNIVLTTRADAMSVQAALKQGLPFGDLARRTSIDASTSDRGGSLGLVSRSDLETAYADAAVAAAVGKPFGPVKTSHGWNVGLVERRLPAKPVAFERVAPQLRATLIQEKGVNLWTDWLRELITGAEIEYALEYRPEDPDHVPPLPGPTTSPGS